MRPASAIDARLFWDNRISSIHWLRRYQAVGHCRPVGYVEVHVYNEPVTYEARGWAPDRHIQNFDNLEEAKAYLLAIMTLGGTCDD